MSLRRVFKETSDGFRRAWGSCLLSILTIAFFLLLLGFLALVSAKIDHFKQTLNDRLQLQVFISGTLDDQEIGALSQRISRIAGVTKVTFVSREMAAEEFQREFGRELFATLGRIVFDEAAAEAGSRLLARVVAANIELAPRERLLLKLCFRDGVAVTEAGRMLGWNRFQVHGRLRRLLERLRRELARVGLEEELRLLL